MEASVANNEEYQQESPTAEASAPETQTGVDVDVSVEALQAQIASLTADLDTARENALRAQAEAQNARRRAEQDVEKAHKFGLERMVNDLLPVVDNLERALAAIDTSDESFAPVTEGIQLTLKSFLDSLARHQVVAVDPQGAPFDPQLHQAVSAVPNPDVEPNTVINVFQKGYTLHGRLVRPAMVVVAKAAD
ncbi:nucleotide exchange factor GrpE [Cellvibrio sp. PSBB006]|uniref:nucleotide exchange factor GrpE n=1 Tax=Cellvibrio sp. PSBB006 TaxID=1987723 RepID=UPI000B3B3623|nr:nucleotide exchange factor GrpE [Cellvibrio sp. PSBB006]ARU29000.1 nucleotide exchange factor GrpE [Cellvibrio sp. PSBB006]